MKALKVRNSLNYYQVIPLLQSFGDGNAAQGRRASHRSALAPRFPSVPLAVQARYKLHFHVFYFALDSA